MASVLPEEAVVRFEGKQYIFEALENNQFRMTEVEVGDIENDYIEIISGEELKNKKIVIKGAYNLLMSLKNIAE